MSMWGLGEGMHRAANSIETAYPWAVYIVGIGSSLHTIALFHFLLHFSGNLNKTKHKFLTLFIIYAPFIFFTLVRFINPGWMISELVHQYWGYTTVGTGLYKIFQYFIVGYTLCIAIMAFIKSYTSEKDIKRQYLYIAIGVFIPVLVGSITQVFRPFFTAPVPELTVISAVSFISIIAYAVKKYGLLAIDIKIVAENIINHVNEFIIAVDPGLNIVFVNSPVSSISEFTETELVKQPIQKIVSDKLFSSSFDEITKQLPLDNYKIDLILKNGGQNSLLANISSIKDGKNNIGFVLVMRNMQNIEELIKHLEEKNIELEKTKKLIEANNIELENTKKLFEQKNIELEKTNSFMVGREVKMTELKRENEKLKSKL